MLILGIETSCDETGAAVIEGEQNSSKVKLLSNVIATSLNLHSQTGGIIPENAAREQVRFIIPVINEAIEQCNNLAIDDVDAIAVTYGPGLIGSLLIGVETAKTLSYTWNKPLIPVNHLIGHIYANFIYSELNPKRYTLNANIGFPAIALIVSGGHTDLVLMKQHGKLKWLGGTRDDAAGEALDKIGRLLALPYPGGPYIEQHAKKGDPNKYKFPRPMIGSKDFDFSFSGLKAAVFREVKNLNYSSSEASTKSRSEFSTSSNNTNLGQQTINDISASVQNAIIDVLVKKTLKAAEKYNAKSILLGGGVAANQSLRNRLKLDARRYSLNAEIFAPSKNLCTDNAAMIGAAAFFNNKQTDWKKVDANPSLYF